MSFGKNLQILRKMKNKMTQEDLAEKMGCSRQTISKWELDMQYPEMDKAFDLCELFSCSMDQLFREDMSICDDSYSDIRIERVNAFQYIRYGVISMEPEDDSKNHVKSWASDLSIKDPMIIGWDFPIVSQEQSNVYNMHGYVSALILENGYTEKYRSEIIFQDEHNYIAITIRRPSVAPFRLIPNAYNALLMYMRANKIKQKKDSAVISCFEKEYEIDGVDYMDIYIAIED